MMGQITICAKTLKKYILHQNIQFYVYFRKIDILTNIIILYQMV